MSTFLKRELQLELHPKKSRIIPLSKGVDFLGFRNFYHFKLPRKRTIRKMQRKIKEHQEELWLKKNLKESYRGWQAHVR